MNSHHIKVSNLLCDPKSLKNDELQGSMRHEIKVKASMSLRQSGAGQPVKWACLCDQGFVDAHRWSCLLLAQDKAGGPMFVFITP